jgi:hypothetical protein
VLRPLRLTPLWACREVRVAVSRFSTNSRVRSTDSVPSRVIRHDAQMRTRSETLEVYHATANVLSMPRLIGTAKHRID